MGNASHAHHNMNNAHDTFLNNHGWATAHRTALPGDFSARHYVRLKDGNRKALLMVMPKTHELQAFITMQSALAASGVRVPELYASDIQHGFALIEDLGEDDFNSLLRKGVAAQTLYPLAIDALLHLHHVAPVQHSLPHFTAEKFLEQAGLFLDVYGEKVMGTEFSAQAKERFNVVWNDALQQACAIPTSLMLRDFHAANIMYLETETGYRKAAMIDFQDGGVGPVSYDIASLLEDARLDVSATQRADMLARYLNQNTAIDRKTFLSSYAVLACQRHMRVLAILARRWIENADSNTGDYFKRSWNLLMLHHAEPALAPVYAWLDLYVPQPYRALWQPNGKPPA
jgi:N-acetylmuramate 1-kinase